MPFFMSIGKKEEIIHAMNIYNFAQHICKETVHLLICAGSKGTKLTSPKCMKGANSQRV